MTDQSVDPGLWPLHATSGLLTGANSSSVKSAAESIHFASHSPLNCSFKSWPLPLWKKDNPHLGLIENWGFCKLEFHQGCVCLRMTWKVYQSGSPSPTLRFLFLGQDRPGICPLNKHSLWSDMQAGQVTAGLSWLLSERLPNGEQIPQPLTLASEVGHWSLWVSRFHCDVQIRSCTGEHAASVGTRQVSPQLTVPPLPPSSSCGSGHATHLLRAADPPVNKDAVLVQVFSTCRNHRVTPVPWTASLHRLFSPTEPWRRTSRNSRLYTAIASAKGLTRPSKCLVLF